MTCVLMVFRAELRRRWGAWLALSLLVALVAGTVLAGVSAARRTASAFPDYVQQYGVDAQAYGFPDLPRTFYSLPNVDTVSTQTYYLNGNALIGSRTISGTLLNVSSIPATHLSKTIKLVSGRLPTSPNEVLVGFSFAQQYRLHQGSVVTVSMYARSQLRTVLNSQGNPPTHGPVLRLVVTGIGLSISDFPT
ncbi:MAG TPA: hypothetical protein VIE15_02260, partial [Acidimicrobiales bacterium]